MAKSRAQRKAEKRRRQEAQQGRQPGRPESERADEERAQEQTQTPVSGDVAEFEAALETGADTEDYGEHVRPSGDPHADTQPRADVPGVEPDPVAPEPVAPAPSRADIPGEQKETRADRRAAKQKEKEQRKRERERAIAKQSDAKAEKKRNPVIAFFISCWAELKKVQWPDRDTLVQASAVTLIFVVVMAAFLGGLDAIFNWMIKQIL
jgi:preprotein translocase subunit SecE